MKNSIIVGFGEVGKSLFSILNKVHTVFHCDLNSSEEFTDVHILHICFPYSKKFISEVRRYQKLYKPEYTIIHSTVKIGTSKKCNAYYSPIRGIHPHLENSLKTFVKYLAPKNDGLAKYFIDAGIQIEQHESIETLEAMKLYCTTLYGLNIIAEKEIWNFCQKHGLDFDIVYTKSNQTYNEGYEKLGFPQFTRYNLKHHDGKIGGHCVIPNCELLKTNMAKYIIRENKNL